MKDFINMITYQCLMDRDYAVSKLMAKIAYGLG